MRTGRAAVFALVVGLIGGFQAGRAEPVPTVVHPTATPAGAEAPQRVLLVGDSILRQTGPALADSLGAGFSVRNVAVNGSGLLTPRFFDWPARVDGELDRITPDLVVVSFIGNYTGDPAGLWTTADGHVVESIEDPTFAVEWGRQTEALLDTLAPTGARVVLVLPPDIPVPAVQAVVEQLRVEYERVAAAHPEVTLVDADAVLEGPEDRAPDGVHLSDRGERRLAQAIADAL
jgi:hypothetical protein